MKKQMILLTLTSLLLTGCGSSTHELSFKVLTPNGAPAVAFYNYATDANFETNGVPSNIISQMIEDSPYDMVVIDTTSGISAINNGAPYKMAATITLGNFYIGATGNDANGVMDDGDTIVLFGTANAVPSKIFHYLYNDSYDSGIEYVTNVANAAACLISGTNVATGSSVDYVFIAQPVLYKALSKNANASIYQNIQTEYASKSEGLPLMQASIFIKNTAKKSEVNSVLSTLQNDIQDGIAHPDKIKAGIDLVTDSELAISRFGVDSETILSVMETNGLGLGYLDSLNHKNAVDAYISLFGMENTLEEIYYQ